MIPLRSLLVFVPALLLIGLSPARTASADPPPPTRLDSDGDPLPVHAVARLGTTRFRHDNGPLEIVYSPDGKMIASSVDMVPFIHIWDAETGKGLHQFLQPEHALSPMIGFTADSKYFGGYHSVWDIKTGEEVLKLGGDFRAFSDEGPRVASFHEREMQVWDLASKKKLRDFPGTFLAFSKDGKRLTTLVENQVVVWDVENGKEVVKIAGKFMTHAGGQIIACSDDKDLHLWDTATGKELAKLPKPFELGEDRYHIPRHAFSPDGKKFAGSLLSDSLQKEIIWDTASGKEVGRLTAPRGRAFLSIVWSPDGKSIATLNDAPGLIALSAYVWDAATGKPIHDKIKGIHLVFSPDSKRIASTDGMVIRTWDAATGEERTPVSGQAGGVLCLSFSADGKSIVAGYDNVDPAPFRTWDVESRKVVRAFGPNPERNLSGLKNKQAVFSPDGKSLFTVQTSRLAMVEASTGKKVVLGDKREYSVRWLAFGPDDKNVTALEMRQVNERDSSLFDPKCNAVFRFLDGSSGRDLPEKDRPRWAAALQRLAPEPGHNKLAFAVSADFRLLAWVRLGNWDDGPAKDVRLCEVATGKELAAVGLDGDVRGLALSPDSRLLAVTMDYWLHLWDIAAGKVIASWPNSQSKSKCVAFAPDGKAVAVGCANGTIVLYDVPRHSESVPVAAADIDRLWNDLAGPDAKAAYRAIARLRADPKSAVGLFANRLKPVPKEASAEAAALAADLDSPMFAKREAASAAIARLGQVAVPALRSALAKNPGAEHRDRLEKALAKLTDHVAATDDVRRLRALQVLEQIGDTAAIELIKKMAEGADEAWITQEARESMARLTKRQ